MVSDRARPAALAFLAVVAIGVAAATLDSTVTTTRGGGSGGSAGAIGGDRSGSASEFALPGNLPETEARLSLPFELPCYKFLTEPAVVAVLVLLLAAGAVVLYRRIGWLGVLAFGSLIAPSFLIGHAALTRCVLPADQPQGGTLAPPKPAPLPSGSAGGGGVAGTPASPLSIALFVVLGIAVIGAVILYFESTGDDTPEPGDDEATGGEAAAAIGRAAGRAADRIESDDADPDNAVYRAWREMTGYLDVANPRSSTPSEFESAAVAAGMNRDDVSELSDLFRDVRYGRADPTEGRERRALAALRRIEAEYADGGD